MAINVGDNFSYQGKKYLDNRQSFKTLSELQAYSNVPEGFIAYCEEDKKRYEYVDGVWTEYVVTSSGTEVNPDCATKAYVDGLIESHTHDEYLTEHQDISHLATKAEIPSLDGLATETYVQEQIANAELGGEEVDLSGYVTEQELEQKGYLTEHQDISHLATKAEIPSLEGLATETYVQEQIANASLGGGEGGSIDTSNFATKAELNTKFDDVSVNEEETTDSQTALDFFANGEKVKTVYFSGGGGGGAAAAYISTTLPEEAMVETGYDFDILIDFYSPNPGKGTLKVFVNDVDALSTPILQGETTTTLSHEKLTKGTNKIVVYVLDRIGTMSNSLTFYVRYGSTELVGEFDSSLAYDYGANIRYYFTATALDTSLALTFYMSIDGAVQTGVSCVSDVRGYFTFPNSLEAGGHYCECWVEDSNGGKSNIETFNLVILDTNTLAIVTETRNPSVEEGSQLVLDYRVYKKNETTFIIKTYVDEELVSTGTCGLTTSYYKTTTLREGMHNIKIEAWDITETVSDYITWSVIITPSTYTMLEPIKAGSMFMASAKNRTNGDPNRETWTGYDQDNNAIDSTLYNFAFNSESGWMDDQLFITGNSYVEVPIQPLANNARYGFTLDVEFSTKPIGVDDAEVLSLWNDTDNCGIKITTDQLILQSKTGNKCELYFSENEIVSAIFIIDRHEKTAKVYLNGVMCAAFALSDYTAEGVSYLEDFTVNDNLYLGKPGSNGYATIKNLRVYELALSSSEILNNFMANEIDKAKQQALVNFQKGEDLPTVTVYCDFSGLGKDDKKYCDIVYNSPDPVKYGESFSLMGKYSQLQYQGTSSMQYPIKNYRLNPKDADGKVKIKLPNCQPETRFTLKADFMSSGHWQNTGLTKWINDNLYNYKEDDPKTMNPAKWWAIQNEKDPNDYRECIYGFPCRLILVNDGTSPLNEGQQEPTPGNTKDMGIFNFNLDKDCQNSLGFTIDDFPNALSMEVTANSDTSAGAFMSFKQHYTLEFIDADSFLESRPANFLGEGTHIIGGTLPTIYTYNGGLQVSSNNYGQSNTFDTDSTITDLLIRFTDKTVSSFSIDGVIYDVVIVEKSNSSECVLLPPSGNELDYIKESFELRYPDEDDVPEGWGFMGIPEDIGYIDYWINNDMQYTTTMDLDYFDSDTITISLSSGNNYWVDSYDSNKGWIGGGGILYEDGSTIDISGAKYIRICDEKGRGASEYIVINGVKYHFANDVTSTNDKYKNPYIEVVMNTSYGLKSLIDWVDNSTDEQFVAEFEEHFHKDYTLRYFLLVMVLGMVDNLGKNMMLDSYDGKIWMPRFYDCDTICSYDNSGAIKFDVDIEMQQGYWNTSSSRLWTRVRDLFHDELVVKYNDMRQNGLSFESLMNVFYNEQIAKIPQKYYNMDADVKYLPYADEYLGKAHGDGYEHLKRWLKNRIIFTDSLYDYAPSYTNDMITFRANTTEEMTITIETYTPVYQHVSWYNGNMQKEKIAKGTQLTFKGFAQAATDQEVLVYGGSNIKRIIGISTMNPNSMLIGNATRLVELDISDCPILTDINSNKANFTPHTYLNKLDISNCPQLGGSLRLNYSPLIGEINAMNTAVTDLQLPSSIRNLHTLKVPGALTSLALNDGPVLSTLEFDGPNNLQSVNLTNCNALTNVVNFDMTQIPTVTLNNSYDADELYMSKTTNLSLVNMANIKKLIFIPNNEHETFNLTELRNCPDYTISAINCPNLKTFMTTAEYRESYKNGEYGDVLPNTAFCANTLDISNTKITDVNFLCTTDVYQLKLPDTVNNFICDSAYDLDTDYLPDGDFDTVHHELIEAYTTDYNKRVSVSEYVIETDVVFTKGKYINNNNVEGTGTEAYISDRIYVKGGTTFTCYQAQMWYSSYYINQYDEDGNFIKGVTSYGSWAGSNAIVAEIESNTAYIIMSYNNRVGSYDAIVESPITLNKMEYYKAKTPNLIPSAADGSLIFSMYAPNTNVAVPAEGIWDLYGLTFEEFYTYGMNNDVVVTDGNITMPHRYADYNVTIQNANIKPTNHPTMLYPLLVNENKPIVGTIDYNNYQGDDLSYAMAYANKAEVDISIPNDVMINSNHSYNTDKDSEYEYNDPRTIAKYTCNAKGVLPTFNSEYIDYRVTESDNGDETYTTRVIANNISNLPTSISFENIETLLIVDLVNITNVTDLSRMFYGCSNLTRINVGDWDTINVINMNRLFTRCKVLETLDVGNWNTKNVTDVAFMFNDCSKLSSLDVSNWDTSSIEVSEEMFYGCSSLTMLDVSSWDTGNMTGLHNMFYNCSSLTSLDVSNWDTSSVTDMSSMFYGCSNLTSLDLSNWDTSSVTSMTSMFGKCSSLTSLDVSNFDTSKVTSINSMFDNCSKLTSLDLSGWDTSSVTNIQRVFALCEKLQNLDISGWVIQNITSTRAIVASCKSLQTLDLSGWDTSQVTDMYYTFNECSGLQSLDLSGWDVSKVTVTANMFSTCASLTSLKWTNWCPQVGTDIGSTNLTTDCLKDLLANLATVTDGQTLTLGSTNLAKVSTADILGAQLKGWTLDGATSTAVVFASDTISGDDTVTECGIQLTQSNKNTRIDEVLGAYTACTAIYLFEDGSVTSLESLFYKNNSTYKSRLTKIDILPGNFGNVKKAYAAFLNCSNVISMDMSGWDTSSLQDATELFKGCSGLTSLNVSGWDTSSATNIPWMFVGCSGLTSLDLSGFNTSAVTNMGCMFQGCSSLESLDISNWDTSNVTNMGNMFNNCSKLTSLDLSGFNTSAVTNMANMFNGCSALTSLNISNWDTSSVTNMDSMFTGCKNLERIKGELVFNNCSANNLFKDCSLAPDLSELHMSGTITGCNYMFAAFGFNNTPIAKELDLSNITYVGSGEITEYTFFRCTVTDIYPFKDIANTINLSGITLTREVALRFINNLVTTTDNLTITFDPTTKGRLTDDDISIIVNKGWTLA